ncbi:MAG: phosphomannomutase [Gammaproteobacteria bacterium]
MSMAADPFKAYDIRGRVPEELDEDLAYRIGRAYAAYLNPGRVVVGRDVRESSETLCAALANGLMDGGADVYDLGLCGTEEVYFATFHHDMDGGIMVTASHNPLGYNGMKLVREGARPISGDDGLQEIEQLARAGRFDEVGRRGELHPLDNREAFVQHLLGYVDPAALKPLRIVVNAGNGGAGLVVDAIESHLPFEFIKIQHEPDGSFPNGIPNPLLPENRSATSEAVIQHGADLGIAWDGDFDRCFFFDERGDFIEGYYIVGLLAEAFLRKHPGEKIVHDPRLTWNTRDMVEALGGVPVQSKTGHAFIKARMRAEDAVYGGEMSAHHYFRDFAYCDSGMIPWLLVAELMSVSGKPLSELVDERVAAYPCSGEINFRVDDTAAKVAAIERHFENEQPHIERVDGLSMEFADWRFNLRASNTEPVLRLNVEARGDQKLMTTRTAELRALIEK